MADAALLLYEVPPKSHGVDDRSPGQTRRSAQKLEKLDGKPGRITNFGAGPIASTAAGGESHTETNPLSLQRIWKIDLQVITHMILLSFQENTSSTKMSLRPKLCVDP